MISTVEETKCMSHSVTMFDNITNKRARKDTAVAMMCILFKNDHERRIFERI